jgi:hypothetical protein
VTLIDCQFPTPDGLQIFMLGQFGTGGPALNMRILPGSLGLTVSTGSGAQFHSRSFTGTGVTSFDAATGAQLDSPLTEVTASTENPKGIGLLKSLAGSIDCGNQVPGTSTLMLTATTPDGDVNGGLDPVRVSCNGSKQFGKSVQVIGVGMVGTTPVSADVVARATGGFSVFLSGSGIAQYFYQSKDPTTATLTDGGAQISGDAASTPAAGAAPLTIHVEGSVVCGTTASGP